MSWRERLPRALAALVLCGAVASCGVEDADVARHALETAERGARAIRDDLSGLLAAARSALEQGPAIDALPQAARFDALESLRRQHRVDGLLWEGPGGESAWAGRVIERRALPADPPWERSFRTGDVAYQDGPFLKALLVGPSRTGTGTLTVSLVLSEQRPGANERAFRERWLEPLDLAAVALCAPETGPEPGFCSHAEGLLDLVEKTGGPTLLRVAARPPGPEATADRLQAHQSALSGAVWLTVLLLLAGGAGVAIRRRIPRGTARLGAAALLVLLVRAALAALDLPQRFPSLARAFQPTDFGVEDPLGWLASPGDLALTAAAFLAVVALLTRGRPAPAAGSAPSLAVSAFLVGTGLAAGSAILAHAVVDLAVEQGQTPFFQSVSFLPPLAAALMLTALVVTTAGAVLLASWGITLAQGAVPVVRPMLARMFAAVLAAALAWWASPEEPYRWSGVLVALAAALPVRLTEPRSMAVSAGRVLLLGVLATALLFPVLWTHVGERRRGQLEGVLQHLLDHEKLVRNEVRIDLESLAEDPRLVRGLARARAGPRPEGFALALWQDTLLARPGFSGVLTVLDERGRLLDEFSLDATPRRRLPQAVPPSGPHDLQVMPARGDVGTLRAVVGRLRVRGSPTANGAATEVLGHLVLTVPDPADLLVTGLSSGPGALLDDGGLLAGRRPLEIAMLQRGYVVASSQPGISREPGGFGPADLGGLSPKNPSFTWDDGESEGVGAWSEERGAVVALRRRAADLGDLVLALARLVVVGAGLAAVAALVVLLSGLRRFRMRLHHRILVSYFVISVIPLVLLAWASVGEARARHDARFTERLQGDIGRARGEFEAQGPQVFDLNTDEALRRGAWERRHDLVLYRADGEVSASSRAGLVEAEIEPARLPAEAYRATVLERRQTIRRESRPDGHALWIGYAPVLGPDGGALATVAVPLLYDKDRIEEELTVTGSVLLAGYLLTLVLVLALGIYAARLLARPLDLLARGTRDVARGDLTVVLPGEGQDELGQLVANFNAMTRALQEATEKAAQAEREAAWRRMARQVAHEIKNPLSPMKLMLQQMEADIRTDPARTSESIHRTASVLLKQIDALARIAGDFANFARLPVREKQPVDVAALVRHVTDLHGGAKSLGIDVAADLPPDGLPTVLGDEEELRRVLVNLVNNAIEAVRGSGRVTVRARPVSHGGHMGVSVEVEDTGVGIAPEHLGRLFEPDFSTKTRGTGLGLAIVKRILDDLGGTIEVESALGRGSAFRMWWPSEGNGTPSASSP